LSAVSGTATYGGTATLTATLTSAETNAGVSGATIGALKLTHGQSAVNDKMSLHTLFSAT
jgi:hypothetical protein